MLETRYNHYIESTTHKENEMNQAISKMQQEMNRLKAYFPYRIVWGALNAETLEFVTGANVTKRQVNDYIRKGWNGYAI